LCILSKLNWEHEHFHIFNCCAVFAVWIWNSPRSRPQVLFQSLPHRPTRLRPFRMGALRNSLPQRFGQQAEALRRFPVRWPSLIRARSKRYRKPALNRSALAAARRRDAFALQVWHRRRAGQVQAASCEAAALRRWCYSHHASRCHNFFYENRSALLRVLSRSLLPPPSPIIRQESDGWGRQCSDAWHRLWHLPLRHLLQLQRRRSRHRPRHSRALFDGCDWALLLHRLKCMLILPLTF